MNKYIDKICIQLERGDQTSLRLGVFAILATLSGAMTILNLIQNKGHLTLVTGVFCVLSVFNIFFLRKKGFWSKFSSFLLTAQVLGMFTIFLISGNPDGFSAIWIVLLPYMSMFLYKRKLGSIVCGIMFAILVFFLWTPLGRSCLMYDYGETFCTRFPILFLSFYLMELFAQSVTEDSLHRTVEFQHLSSHDMLTGLYNRKGMYPSVDRLTDKSCRLGVAMVDIDFFKTVNDTYGHAAGDHVLQNLADYMFSSLDDAIICRWGGEEFVAVYELSKVSHKDIEGMLQGVAEMNLLSDDFPEAAPVTISIGVCEDTLKEGDRIDLNIDKADLALYQAKRSGRNKVVYWDSCSAIG